MLAVKKLSRISQMTFLDVFFSLRAYKTRRRILLDFYRESCGIGGKVAGLFWTHYIKAYKFQENLGALNHDFSLKTNKT